MAQPRDMHGSSVLIQRQWWPRGANASQEGRTADLGKWCCPAWNWFHLSRCNGKRRPPHRALCTQTFKYFRCSSSWSHHLHSQGLWKSSVQLVFQSLDHLLRRVSYLPLAWQNNEKGCRRGLQLLVILFLSSASLFLPCGRRKWHSARNKLSVPCRSMCEFSTKIMHVVFETCSVYVILRPQNMIIPFLLKGR